MTAEELAAAYLQALRDADLAAMLALFTPDAVVHSPLYGPTPVAAFYPALFADTSEARVSARGLTTGTTTAGAPLVAVWFHFDWRLPGGRRAPFDVVDVMELAAGRIAALHIVYDTVDVRPAYEHDTGHPSWRPTPSG